MKSAPWNSAGERRAFVVRTRSTEYTFPFAKLRLHPQRKIPLRRSSPIPNSARKHLRIDYYRS